MKLAKLSLAAIVVAGLASSSFAASDTLADAFKNGKVNGELRAWYFDRDTGVSPATLVKADIGKKGSESIFNTGVILGYVTDSLYGLSLGLTMQSNYSPFADDATKQMFATDSFGSGAVLSEAYIQYQIGKTTAKVGRQFIATPLVNGSGSRMIKEAFEGAVIINTDVPQTTLVAGAVNKFQGRTSDIDRSINSDQSDIADFKKTAVIYGAGAVLAFDGAYTAAVINSSIPNLTLTAQYALVNDVVVPLVSTGDANVYYGEANYVLPLSNMKLLADVNYRGSKLDSSLDAIHANGNMYQGRVGFKELAGFGASFAYSTVSNDESVILGMGNGPTTYTAPLIKAAEVTSAANTDAYLVQATYDFGTVGVTGLKILGQYAKINADKVTNGAILAATADTKYTYLEGQVAYDIPNLKGLTLSLEYEDGKKEIPGTTTNTSEMRFRANYKF